MKTVGSSVGANDCTVHAKTHPALPCAWWHQRPPQLPPVEAVRIAAEHLERGIAVPHEAAALVAKAFREYLSGRTDITANLGLRPSKGGRHSVFLARKADRDEKIKTIYQALHGTRTSRAKTISNWLAVPPSDGEITDSDIAARLVALHREHGGDLPGSWEQVLRVVGKQV